MNIGIVGLGLIGGSFAQATKERTDHHVYGFDTDTFTMQTALGDRVIEGVLTNENLPSMDLVVLAVVPHLAVRFVEDNAALIRGTVLDCCGVKRAVSAGILPLSDQHGFRYVGGHPMAGREHGGYENATPNLFDDASMLLVPHGELPDWLAPYLWSLGFRPPVVTDDETHDRVLAYTSQMAHIVSSNYCKSPTGREHRGYSADSLKDLTRVASLNPVMWSELLIANADCVLPEVERLVQNIETMCRAIRAKDRVALERLLAEGSAAKAEMYPRGTV